MEFRFATRQDVPLILQFIKELAEYEKLLDEVVATEELLEQWIFDKQKAEVIFALEDGREVGFALFFHNFSPFWAELASILRTCMFEKNTDTKDMAKAC